MLMIKKHRFRCACDGYSQILTFKYLGILPVISALCNVIRKQKKSVVISQTQVGVYET